MTLGAVVDVEDAGVSPAAIVGNLGDCAGRRGVVHTAEERSPITKSVCDAPSRMVSYLTRTSDVLFLGRDEAGNEEYRPAKGLRRSGAALHVISRIRTEIPATQLGMHTRMVGAERPDGTLCDPDTEALFGQGAQVEGEAVHQLLVADGMQRLGFPMRAGTGSKDWYFEVDGNKRRADRSTVGSPS